MLDKVCKYEDSYVYDFHNILFLPCGCVSTVPSWLCISFGLCIGHLDHCCISWKPWSIGLDLEIYQCCIHFTTGFTFETLAQFLTGTASHFFSFFFAFPISSLISFKIERLLRPSVHSYLEEMRSSTITSMKLCTCSELSTLVPKL